VTAAGLCSLGALREVAVPAAESVELAQLDTLAAVTMGIPLPCCHYGLIFTLCSHTRGAYSQGRPLLKRFELVVEYATLLPNCFPLPRRLPSKGQSALRAHVNSKRDFYGHFLLPGPSVG